MATKITASMLKKHLSGKTKAELIEEISQMHQKFPTVQEYVQANYFGDDESVLEKYTEIVRAEFEMRGNRFPKMRLSVAKKAITDFKKISNSAGSISDLMIVYVEAGVSSTMEFGDIDEAFYNSMESVYEMALKYVVKENLFSIFEERLYEIVENTSGIGWGFHDQLAYLYDLYEPVNKTQQDNA